MKICMPVGNANGSESILFGHFGSAPYFALYDANSKEITFVDNDESTHTHGSCMPVEALRKNGAGAVLCMGMGMRAIQLLTQAGVTPFFVEAETVAEAISKYEAGKVRTMDAASACSSHSCH